MGRVVRSLAQLTGRWAAGKLCSSSSSDRAGRKGQTHEISGREEAARQQSAKASPQIRGPVHALSRANASRTAI